MASDRRVTVPVRFLRPLLRELPLHGVAAEEALQCPGGPLSAAALLRGDTEIDREDFVHAYGMCTRLLEQAICRPRAKSDARRKAFELIFNFMVAAGDLREACERAAQFNAMIEERGYTLGLSVATDIARFTIDLSPSISRPPPALIAAAMVFFQNVFSWLTGARIGLRRIGLVTTRPRAADPCLEILGAPIAYGEAENFLAFDAADLARKVIRSAEDLEGIVDYIGYDPLFCFRPGTSFAAELRSLLLDRAQRGAVVPDSVLAADLMGISVSTLSRRLRRENTTFLKLKSDCQRDIAKELLRHGALTMAEIAKRLGFVDARSFRRAFQDWTGVLPSAFRANPASAVR
jgi:AraC-like DNA-binding protein